MCHTVCIYYGSSSPSRKSLRKQDFLRITEEASRLEDHSGSTVVDPFSRSKGRSRDMIVPQPMMYLFMLFYNAFTA